MAKRTELQMARDGEFLREYGKTHFCVIAEALEIGRVKFSLVPIGKSGKDDLVFYMTVEDFLELCSDFRTNKAQKKIAADAGSYPSAYKYTTGKDGSLHLAIGGGKIGARIQIQDTIAKKNYTMAVSVASLEKMAKKFMIDTGYTPVTADSYYGKVVAAFEEGRKARSNTHKNVEIDDAVNDNELVEEVKTPVAQETVVEKNTADPVAEEPKSNKSNNNPSMEYTLKAHGSKLASKGFYIFNAELVPSGEKVRLLIREGDTKNLDWYDEFEKRAAEDAGTQITVNGERRDNYILLTV